MPDPKKSRKESLIRGTSILAAATAICLLIFFVLMLPNRMPNDAEQLNIRTVELYVPPPPEPPPIRQQPENQTPDAPSVNVRGPGSEATLSYSDNPVIDVRLPDHVQRPDFDVNALNMQRTISVQFPIFGVENLDRIPRVVASRAVAIPRPLRNRGIHDVRAVVDIIIVESGRAYIKQIVDPVHAEMVSAIREYMEHVRFTQPTKDGHPVQAEYRFNMNFQHRL